MERSEQRGTSGRERPLQSFVIPAKAGIQGMGVSFDKLRTNELSVYLPL